MRSFLILFPAPLVFVAPDFVQLLRADFTCCTALAVTRHDESQAKIVIHRRDSFVTFFVICSLSLGNDSSVYGGAFTSRWHRGKGKNQGKGGATANSADDTTHDHDDHDGDVEAPADTYWLDIDGTLQLFNSDHVRERDKALLRSVFVGGVWNGFMLGKVKGLRVPCRFFGGAVSDGHLFGECPFPLIEIRGNPEFHDLMEMDKSSWPWCLLWHGWLPRLFRDNGGSPWAEPSGGCFSSS